MVIRFTIDHNQLSIKPMVIDQTMGHRCAFSIGWLIFLGGFEGLPL